jgi:ABC-type Fe3+-siderophore transport system permease subunit
MKKLLALAAASEAATGLLLMLVPAIVVRLLFGAEIAGAGILMNRMLGIALVALGIACWPRNIAHGALFGMLAYSTLAMFYLAYVGIGGVAGILLWPAVAVHAALSVLLVLVWRKEQKSPSAKT